MKGVILAGGLGTRLDPLTRITNKHLLPVYDRPMIHYPLMTLVSAGIKDIMIVTGGNNAGDFLRLLGNGKEFGLKHINYTYQKGEGGIAQALSLTEDFVDEEKVAVILGDNFFERPIKAYVAKFTKQAKGARIFLKQVPHPEKFGAVEIRGNKILSIEEKPKKPKSNYVGTGLYMYDHKVFDFIKTLKPSWRNELEITDVNNMYRARGELSFDVIKGFWSDCGTFSSLLRANNFVAKKSKRKD